MSCNAAKRHSCRLNHKNVSIMPHTEQTQVRAKRDLYNKGKCFTKDKIYVYDGRIDVLPSLMEKTLINDLGERHIIGSWWREFELVKEEEDEA